MRLKQVNIERYGPLNQVYLRLGKGVQPIFGENETGKTLCVDALLKRLTGIEVGWDPSLDRVEETPEGFLVLEDDGKEVKLEKGETLADYLSIDAGEFKNIFVIRDADLRIREEDVFYERVQDRITGLRSRDIRRIMEKLMELGRLTLKKKDISDLEQHHKAGSNLKEAKELQKGIRKYLEEAQKKGIPDLEAEIFEDESQYAALDTEIKLQEKAEDKDKFLKLDKKFQEANAALENLGKVPPEQNIAAISTKLQELKVEENAKPLFERVRAVTQNLSYLALPSVAVTWIVSLLFGLSGVEQIMIPLILLFFLCTLLIGWFWSSWKLSAIENRWTDLVAECQDIEVTGKTISELKRGLDKLREKRNDLATSLDQKIGVLTDALNIDEKSREEALKKASEVLLKKKTTIDFEVPIEFDENKAGEAKEKLTKIEGKLKDLRQVLTDHKESMKEFSNRAHKLDFRTFMGRELELEIENLESLRLLDKELEEFAGKIESDAYLCRKAVEIFEELGSEEEAKISELFGEDSTTAQIFKQITGGRYGEVRYDHENKTIVVVRPSGQSLSANKLSKGAFDQLYLSIRIDLAQRLLEGRKGFFIMDDAFLSSSSKRFREQVNLLSKLSDMGWQTVYFTVKAEDSRALSQISGSKVIRLEPLP
jgi:hypothetical protein